MYCWLQSTKYGFGDKSVSSIRYLHIAEPDCLTTTETQVLITSKGFNPKSFISVVHPNATYQDLNAGVHHLRSALDSRSEAIRILVEQNFDRFVAVKNNTDGELVSKY